MSDDFANEIASPSKTNWFVTLVLVALAGLAFGWFIRELANPQFPGQEAEAHPSVGKPAPEMVVEGWFNDDGPKPEDLAGKVYVVDAWEFWCKPCLQYAPHTIELYEKYKDRGVIFLGLTSAPNHARKKSLKFLELAKFPWPNGYGAIDTLLKFYETDETPIPHLWVVDRHGVIAWAGHPLRLNEELLDKLLAEEPPVTPQTDAQSEAADAQTPSPGG